MKKIITSIILIAILMSAFSVTAFATDTDINYITVSNDGSHVELRWYNADSQQWASASEPLRNNTRISRNMNPGAIDIDQIVVTVRDNIVNVRYGGQDYTVAPGETATIRRTESLSTQTVLSVELRRVGDRSEWLSPEEMLAIPPQDRLQHLVYENQADLDLVRHLEMAVLYYTNVERVKAGVPPLMWSESYANVARMHSLDMDLNRRMTHTGSDGSSAAQRVRRAGLTGNFAGENITRIASLSPESMVYNWMNSPGHRANILNRSTRVLGVGIAGGHTTQKFANGNVADAVPLETVFSHEEFRRLIDDFHTQSLLAPDSVHLGRIVAPGTFVAYNDGTHLNIFITDDYGRTRLIPTQNNPRGRALNGAVAYAMEGNIVTIVYNGQTYILMPGDEVTIFVVDNPIPAQIPAQAQETPTVPERTTPQVPAQNNEITILVNGNPISFDQPPIIQNGRTLVPMRAIFEAMGAEVTWIESTQTAQGARDTTLVTMRIGHNIMTVSSTISVDAHNFTLDVPPQIIGGRTLVPARAIAEAFGAEVEWNAATQTVIITEDGEWEPTAQQTPAQTALTQNDAQAPAENNAPAAQTATAQTGNVLHITFDHIVERRNANSVSNGSIHIITNTREDRSGGNGSYRVNPNARNPQTITRGGIRVTLEAQGTTLVVTHNGVTHTLTEGETITLRA